MEKVWHGVMSAHEWLAQQNAMRRAAEQIAGGDPFQAYRAGYAFGGEMALHTVEVLTEEKGYRLSEAVALVRAYWKTAVLDWSLAPTVPGQEVVPLIPLTEDMPTRARTIALVKPIKRVQ